MIGNKLTERTKRPDRTVLTTTIITVLFTAAPYGIAAGFGDDGAFVSRSRERDVFVAEEPIVPVSRRPSFLPSTEETPVSSAGESEDTMVAQIELPVPKPVSEALQRDAEPDPSANSQEDLYKEGGRWAQNDATSPSIIFEDEQPGLRREPAPPPPAPDPGVLLKQKRYGELEPLVAQSRDAKLAAALGWSLYNENKFERASYWFQQALKWDDREYEAAYGLSLVLLRQKEYDKAEEVAKWRVAEYPRMRNVLGDVQTARAVAAYRAKNYKRSSQLFEEVRQYRTLTRDERIVQAWNEFHVGNVSAAGEQFVQLYEENPDKFAAGGVYAAYSRRKDWAGLEQVSKQYGGPLQEMYQRYVAQRYYDRGLYRRAYAAAPEKFPELQNITSPAVSAAAGVRFKSGDTGRSKLREIRGEASGVMYQNDFHRLSARIGLTSLDAGRLPEGELVGKAPLSGDRRYRHGTKTSYDSLVDVRLRYEHQGTEYSPYVELGISPAGGAVSPTVVGAAGMRADHEWGTWTGEVFRESIKESILSYTGMVDPFTGDTWGRVTESGLRLSLFLPMQDQWSAYGELVAGVLDGESVETNSHVRFTLAFNRQIEHPDFSYITVGPAFTFEHYSENLSYFTFGQGGYFSPDYLFQGTIGGHFLTRQGRSWLLKGDLDVGLQTYKQGTTSVFPLDDDISVYPQTDDQTFIATAGLTGMLQLTPRWALGGQIGYNRTADYSEFTAGLSLTYFFDSRSGLFLSDFSTF